MSSFVTPVEIMLTREARALLVEALAKDIYEVPEILSWFDLTTNQFEYLCDHGLKGEVAQEKLRWRSVAGQRQTNEEKRLKAEEMGITRLAVILTDPDSNNSVCVDAYKALRTQLEREGPIGGVGVNIQINIPGQAPVIVAAPAPPALVDDAA